MKFFLTTCFLLFLSYFPSICLGGDPASFFPTGRSPVHDLTSMVARQSVLPPNNMQQDTPPQEPQQNPFMNPEMRDPLRLVFDYLSLRELIAFASTSSHSRNLVDSSRADSRIDLHGSNLSPDALIWRLKSYLQYVNGEYFANEEIIEINLSESRIDINVLKFIGKYFPNLEILKISNLKCDTRPIIVELTNILLSKFSKLTHLDLSINQIGDAGAQALAAAIANRTNLTHLDLYQNQIGDAGAQALADALANHTNLTRLDLSKNQIGDAGAQALADALANHTKLTHLNLNFNPIGDAGAQALADSLANHPNLTIRQ
ncbi:MAG: leucine-rich repeat domain-containing protein [Silvanigrellaceae bacterium]|nr:leucine-rich repeat domain-containing protein [Silvanigrellaceae bacterium]